MKVKIGKYPKKSKRKVKVEIDAHDLYSLDHTLALVIAPALKAFKKNLFGYPSCFMSEVQAELSGVVPKTPEQRKIYKREEKKAIKEWTSVLESMWWAFDAIANDKSLSFVDEGERRNHERKIQFGLDLFAKYYGNLWT